MNLFHFLKQGLIHYILLQNKQNIIKNILQIYLLLQNFKILKDKNYFFNYFFE